MMISRLNRGRLLALCLCVGTTVVVAQGGLRPADHEAVARNLVEYSKRATIVPDPDVEKVDETVAKDLAAKYGRWHFWDGEEAERPDDSGLCGDFPSCDFVGDDLEDTQWQADAVYVNHILNDADELVGRAMEALFEEYGHPKPETAEGLAERMKMFHWDKIDLKTVSEPPEPFRGKRRRGNGGWTTKRSFEGLVRRLLHAMMTTSTFTVVLAGHSSAAGHGNHFRQSYMMQFHKVVAPILARLGVKLITRNISQGGLGTIQNAMASGSLYGDEVDLLIWDSGMTEKQHKDAIDLFFRQGLIGGKRVPVIWSAGGQFDLLKMLHNEADVDVGEFGLGLDGIAETTSDEQAKTLPWAVQYMKCSQDKADVCKQHNEYCGKCWVDREDGIKPEEPQQPKMGGQVSWHPGWRQHQLTGRVIAYSVLEALQQAVQQFSEGTMGGPPLADEYWHVDEYYKNIREKVKNLDKKKGNCKDFEGKIPTRICSTPMKGFSHYTPRANFDKTGIVSIVKPAKDGSVPKNDKKALYEGRNAHNSCFDIPEGQVDVLAIVSGRRRRNLQQQQLPQIGNVTKSAGVSSPSEFRKTSTRGLSEPSLPQQAPLEQQQQHRGLDEIKPGRGWELVGEPQGYCDGTYDAVCNRETHHPCVLGGHHDARAALVGNAFSGWLVMTVPKVKEGIIMIKVHTWNKPSDNTITKDWKSENNERRLNLGAVDWEDDYDDSDQQHRLLKDSDTVDNYPDSFVFEYAVNGKVTSLNKEKFKEKRVKVQRVVEVLTLMDDPNFKGEADVEVAIRLQGCGKECVIGLTHLYYA